MSIDDLRENWQKVAAITVIVLTLIGAIATSAVALYQIDDHTTSIDGIKKEQKADHDILIDMRNDIKWIRRELDRK